MLLDSSKGAADWLAELSREAAGTFGADRVPELQAALQRLSRALALVAATGPELDIRARDAMDSERERGTRRG